MLQDSKPKELLESLLMFVIQYILPPVVTIFVMVLFFEIFLLEQYIRLERLSGFDRAIYTKYQIAKDKQLPFDTRGQWEVVDTYNSSIHDKEKLIYPMFGAYWLKTEIPGFGPVYNKPEFVPLTGPSLHKIVTDSEGGTYGIHLLDEHGFNNPTGLYDKPVDIAVVGDSFAEGISVNSGEDSVSFIRQLQYPNSLNFGKAGAGPLSVLATIREYVEIVKPKIVLWYYYEGNDLQDIPTEINVVNDTSLGNYLVNYLNPQFTQNLFNRQKEIDKYIEEVFWPRFIFSIDRGPHGPPLTRSFNTAQEKILQIKNELNKRTFLDKLLLKSSFLYFKRNVKSLRVKLAELINPPEQFEPSHRDMVYFDMVMRLAKKSIESYGGKLIFVYIPEFYRIEARDAKKYYNQSNPNNKQKVLSMISDIGLDIIDITPEILNHKDPLSLYFFRMHGHFNVEGNEFIAKIILNKLNNLK
ncbi:MAG: hypothetical protein L3V56_00010 [Candidatus Magnetoovum sp. WYHC-5]|nr:hypothetical protein [Candidatus Magnetoovum sp. WYHC-5]